MSWHPIAYQFLQEKNYQQAAQFYEEAVENYQVEISNYWYLGLVYLLEEKEEEAQTTWLLAMSQGTEVEIEQWTQDLGEILDTEARRQEQIQNYHLSWLIRAQLREIEPRLINNLLHLIDLEIRFNRYKPQLLLDWQLVEILQESHSNQIKSDLLLKILADVLQFPAFITVAFAQASWHHISEPEIFVSIVKGVAIKMAYNHSYPAYGADLTEICLEVQPLNLQLLDQLFWFNSMAARYSKALQAAEQFYNQAQTLPLKVFAQYKILHALVHSGAWLKAQSITKDYIALVQQMIKSDHSLDPLLRGSIQSITTPLFYIQDNPRENRWLQNQLSKLFQDNLPTWCATSSAPQSGTRSRPQLKKPISSSRTQKQQPHTIKIGYIAHTLRKHSIGWLSRWLLHYRNRETFQVVIYLVNQPEDEITQTWFRKKADLTYNFANDPQEIALQIQKDEIDILVDLDSITNAITCQVMALKPAPVQVTWLGFDASGIPAIDYFIADPYVLPSDAQDYYQEKIWRLPHCYMAVDGFETGVSTLRREQLNIPTEAIIYLSAQTGLKRHPDTIRLQIKIIKEVPNSYFLIQGLGDEEKIKQLFIEIAQQEGVSSEKLRFLPTYPTEIYRANLGIADVVLDTYPFNGGTTTLDILWQGIPIVTRVGQQWASRNGYTLLTNAGLTEGIAWTDEEYVEWGILLGTDAKLRQHIAWKLKNSLKIAPLWNAQQFTREMENAYRQMFISH